MKNYPACEKLIDKMTFVDSTETTYFHISPTLADQAYLYKY